MPKKDMKDSKLPNFMIVRKNHRKKTRVIRKYGQVFCTKSWKKENNLKTVRPIDVQW